MQKIDAHVHVDLAGMDAGRLIEYMDRNGIDMCWLHTWEELSPPIDNIYQTIPVTEVFEVYEQHPDRIVPFYAPDPKTKKLEQKIKKRTEQGLKGCGELKVTHTWADKVITDYLRIIDRYDLPLLFHMEEPRMHYVPQKPRRLEKMLDMLLNGALNGITKHYLMRFSRKTSILKDHIEDHLKYFPGYLYDFANLEKRLQQFPGIDFIGHGPHFWNNISDDPPEILFHDKGTIESFGVIDRLLSTYDNFYCDISGKSGYNALTRDRDKAREFLEKHYAKILFGTDNTAFGLEELILSFHLPEEKLKKIFFENAADLVRR